MAILNAQQAVNTRDLPELEPIIGDMPPDPVTGDGAILHGPIGINYKFGANIIELPGTYVFAGQQVVDGPIESITVEKSGNAAYVITEFDLNIEELWADAGDNGKLDTVPAEIFKGDDELVGSTVKDVLFAFDGDDLIQAGGGDDEIDGGEGEDDIIGDLGADVMSGGAGPDTFFYSNILESTKKASGRDTILDFNRLEGDRVDLIGIDAKKGGGDQEFKWIGKKDFHHKKGELHYKVKNGDSYVEGDTDGNGKADFVIVFDSVTKMKGSDFEL